MVTERAEVEQKNERQGDKGACLATSRATGRATTTRRATGRAAGRATGRATGWETGTPARGTCRAGGPTGRAHRQGPLAGPTAN
jgi:hypothetical protein